MNNDRVNITIDGQHQILEEGEEWATPDPSPDTMYEWHVLREETTHENGGTMTCTFLIDVVFYQKNVPVKEVWLDLVNHDSYPSDIMVVDPEDDDNRSPSWEEMGFV